MINWNMVILLVFISFNVTVICEAIKTIFIPRGMIKAIPADVFKKALEEEFKDGDE